MSSLEKNNISAKKTLLDKVKNTTKALAAGAVALTALNEGGVQAQDNTLPTRQDSIDLLNNTNDLLKFYEKYDKLSEEYTTSGNYYADRLKQVRDVFNKDYKTIDIPTTNRGLEDKNIQSSDFYQYIDDNKFKQRENANSMLDLRAPMTLYDKRINPNKLFGFQNNIDGDILEGDVVSFYTYSPLQVTPWDMLSPEQQKERLEKYGTDGTPYNKSPEEKVKTGGGGSSEVKQIKIENKETLRDALIFRADVPNWQGFRYSKEDRSKELNHPSNKNGGLCFSYAENGNVLVITREEFKRLRKIIQEQGDKATTKILIDLPEDIEDKKK